MASTVKEAQPQFVLSDAAGMAAAAAAATALHEGMRVADGVLPSGFGTSHLCAWRVLLPAT